MSEYQYYDFLALDKALTSKQREELRQLSTRAEITATRFTNDYQWGNFRGDPAQMMARYFDAFLYLANWGTRHLMFRVPKTTLETEYVRQYCYTEAASLIETDDHLIISLYADHEPDDFWSDAPGELGSLVSVRLTSAPAADLADWIATLPAADKDDLLTLVATGDGARAQGLLLRRFPGGPFIHNDPAPSARTAAQLWTVAEAHKISREEAEAQALRAEEERRAAAEAAAYDKRLDNLASRAEAAWREAAERFNKAGLPRYP
jgi:hypothetical protein